MLTRQLDVTYTMVWSIAIANILGAGVLFLFSGQLAKIALLRYTLILPTVMSIIYIGSFQASRAWGDLYTLLLFGILGWVMKHMRWPRPPLILGFVLGAIIERYMFISISRYGFEWFSRPIVAVLLILAVLGLMRPLLGHVRAQGGFGAVARSLGRPVLKASDLMYVFFFTVIAAMLYQASGWQFRAMVGPTIVGSIALTAIAFSFLYAVCSRGEGSGAVPGAQAGVHMDMASDHSGMPLSTVMFRAMVFFAWLLFFMASMSMIGTILTVPLFVVLYMRLEGREPWTLVLGQAVVLTTVVYLVFDQLLRLPWPRTWLGQTFTELRFLPGV